MDGARTRQGEARQAEETVLGAMALPGACYTSERFFAAEMAHIHRRNWVFVGREEEWARPGDYRAIDTVGGPVIVLRDRAGALRAFANVCRHRGSILVEGSGNARVIACPYHAWSYGLDGALMGAPGMDRSPGFDRTAHGLAPIRLESWAGFAFLNFDDAAPSLLEYLGDLPQVLGGHRCEEMVCTWRYDIDCRCNWKLLVENALESYHTGIVHVRTVGAQTEAFRPTEGNWLNLQVLSRTSVAVLSDTPPLPPIEGLSEEAQLGTYFTMVMPTTQIICAQDCAWWLAMRPIAPDHTHLSLGGCFPRKSTELPDFAANAAPYYDRWVRVAQEDVGMLQRQQVGLASPLYRPGRLSWRDELVHAVHRWVMERVPAGAVD